MANDKTARRGVAFSPSASVRAQRMVDLIQKVYARRVTLATADALERAAVFLEDRFGSRARARNRGHHATRMRAIPVPRPSSTAPRATRENWP